MVLFVAAGTALAFLAGTAAHEMTHWLAAKATGCRVESVRLFPPAPQVVFDAATPGLDRTVRGITVPAAAIVLSACLAASRGQSLAAQMIIAAFGIAYLPRSRTDWQPVKRYLSR